MLQLTSRGLYCSEGSFHIDPSGKVDLGLITHAHADHARPGSREYLCVDRGVELLRHRLGPRASIRTVAYGERLNLGSTTVSFHPAGHVLGSAQIRIERGGEVWVASGDYKRDEDPSCDPFEVVRCDTFVTEATFGHPRYRWPAIASTLEELRAWWSDNAAAGRNSVIFCYALGKTQRVLGLLAGREVPGSRIYVHGEGAALSDFYRARGVRLAEYERLADSIEPEAAPRGALVIATQGLFRGGRWPGLLHPFQTAFASGWTLTGRGGRYHRGFPLSDHSDWNGLVRTVRETGAQRVLVMHAPDPALVGYLREQGLQSALLKAAPRDTATEPRVRARGPVQGELFSRGPE